MRISYFGNFYNHGEPLSQWGTGLMILLSRLDYIDKVDIFCPVNVDGKGEMNLPDKITLIPCFDVGKPFSFLKAAKMVKRGRYDLTIFNLNPTAFGIKSTSNLMGLIAPFIASSRDNEISVIYHSSVITNDPASLGYNSLYDKLRKRILFVLESYIFKRLRTYVLLDLYKRKIKEKIGDNKVEWLFNHFIDGVPALYINGLIDAESIERVCRETPTILLPGSWGPQKNLPLALQTIEKLKIEGYDLKVVLSGSSNSHFKGYSKEFDSLIERYSNVIDECKGYVPEDKMLDLFLEADLILMPYSIAGGQSGLIEMSALFETPIIGIEFPEYSEKNKTIGDNLTLTSKERFYETVEKFLGSWHPRERNTVDIRSKIERSLAYAETLLDPVKN